MSTTLTIPGVKRSMGSRSDRTPRWTSPHSRSPTPNESIAGTYWIFVAGDALPWPLNCFVFDAAVNQGVSPAIRLLQTALGVEDDGVIGPQTLSAVGKFPLPDICSLYLALRGMRYSSTVAFERYGKGWLKRLFLALWKANL
jgi:lysozyme family protein